MYHSATTHNKKTNRQNFPIWNSHGLHGPVIVATSDTTFLAVQFCSYTMCRTQYDQPDRPS